MRDGDYKLGNFHNKLSLSTFAWDQKVRSCLAELCEWEKDASLIEIHRVTVEIHELKLLEFYDGINSSDLYKVNSICLCCFTNAPAYTLSCGHVICRCCARDFGKVEGRNLIMTKCPLHCSVNEERRPVAAKIRSTSDVVSNPEVRGGPRGQELCLSVRLSPAFSGCRTLTLDG
jgi:hypothetical protein